MVVNHLPTKKGDGTGVEAWSAQLEDAIKMSMPLGCKLRQPKLRRPRGSLWRASSGRNCSWGVLLGFANSGWDMDGRGKRREELHHPWHSFHFHVVFKIMFHGGYFHAKVAPTHLFSSRLQWLCLVGQRSRHRHSCTLHAAIAVRTARPDSKTCGLRCLVNC